MSLDRTVLRELAGLTDEVGVLSAYLTIDRQARVEQGSKPPWEVRLRNRLRQIREDARQEWPREHWRALETRIDALEPEWERLLDPVTTGVGRALFATVAGGAVHHVSLQVPLDDRVVCEPRAYVRPLVAAWSTAGPAGVVAVSADEVRIMDLRLGATEMLAILHYQRPTEQPELKGPPSSLGLPGNRVHGAGAGVHILGTGTQRDLYERREDDKLLRFLRTVGPRVVELTKEREWSQVALTGEASLVQAVREGIPPSIPAEVVEVDAAVASAPPAKLAATVEPALAEARLRHHRALAERVRDHALSANNGTFGLGDTLNALQEGRVAHLLLDAERRWSGSRSPDGLLAPEGEVPVGADRATLAPEPHLGERMIELALDSSAEVTILDPSVAEPLTDGVGALLRW